MKVSVSVIAAVTVATSLVVCAGPLRAGDEAQLETLAKSLNSDPVSQTYFVFKTCEMLYAASASEGNKDIVFAAADEYKRASRVLEGNLNPNRVATTATLANTYASRALSLTGKQRQAELSYAKVLCDALLPNAQKFAKQ